MPVPDARGSDGTSAARACSCPSCGYRRLSGSDTKARSALRSRKGGKWLYCDIGIPAVRFPALVPAGPTLQTSTDACQPTIGTRGAYQRRIVEKDIIETSVKVAFAGAFSGPRHACPIHTPMPSAESKQNRSENRSTSASTRRRASDRAY